MSSTLLCLDNRPIWAASEIQWSSGQNGRMLLSFSHAQVSARSCNNKEAPLLRPPHVHRRLVSWGNLLLGRKRGRRRPPPCVVPPRSTSIVVSSLRLTKSQETRNKLSRQTARTHTGLKRREDWDSLGLGASREQRGARAAFLYRISTVPLPSPYFVPRVPYETFTLSLSNRPSSSITNWPNA